MGNCQAAEAATVVIQHPGGKIERLYWPTTAEDVMKSNPGHHVALVTLCVAQTQTQAIRESEGGRSSVTTTGHLRFTRVRLLKPKDILLIGQVYRLITSQEVSKALKARKVEKIKKAQSEQMKKQVRVQSTEEVQRTETETMQAENQERGRQKSSGARARQWRPKLQSISEGVS